MIKVLKNENQGKKGLQSNRGPVRICFRLLASRRSDSELVATSSRRRELHCSVVNSGGGRCKNLLIQIFSVVSHCLRDCVMTLLKVYLCELQSPVECRLVRTRKEKKQRFAINVVLLRLHINKLSKKCVYYPTIVHNP